MDLKPITDRFLKHNSEVINDCKEKEISFEDYVTDEVCWGHNMKKLGRIFRKGRVEYNTTFCPECDLEIADFKAQTHAQKEAFINKCAVQKQENSDRSANLRAKKKGVSSGYGYKDE